MKQRIDLEAETIAFVRQRVAESIWSRALHEMACRGLCLCYFRLFWMQKEYILQNFFHILVYMDFFYYLCTKIYE